MSTVELTGKIEESDASATALSCGNAFFHQCMAIVSIAMVLCAVLCVVVFHFKLPESQASVAMGYLPFVAALGYCWWQQRFQLFQACALACWSCLFSILLQFPMYLASQFHAPLADAQLSHLDHSMHLEMPIVLGLMIQHHWTRQILNVAYDLLFPFIVLSAVLPAMRFRFTAAKELIAGTIFGTMVGTVLFGFFPAVGPWVVYHYAPNAQQADTAAYFLSLRAAGTHVIDLNRSGFISFPSFHVFLAILAAIALSSIRPLRIPSFVLAGIISISTMTTGWHYFTDVMGGILLALISAFAAKTLTWVEARRMRSSA